MDETETDELGATGTDSALRGDGCELRLAVRLDELNVRTGLLKGFEDVLLSQRDVSDGVRSIVGGDGVGLTGVSHVLLLS
jgi:hypothetical protein